MFHTIRKALTNTSNTRSSRKDQGRRPGVESLERREMMTGNVSVSLNFGTLYIEGDRRDNVIEIRQLTNGDFRVESEDGGASARF